MIEEYSNQIFYNAYGMKVWQQRHLKVQQLLKINKATKIIDFGCCEGLLIQRLSRSIDFQLLIGVDIDQSTLIEITKHNIEPQPYQQNIKYNRKQELIVKIFKGSVKEKYQNLYSYHVDAITLIQVIEHLHQQELPQLNQSVFGYYSPQIVIITTPNRQFNVWFGESEIFRHYDHKYEWDRNQFRQYCQNISILYGYSYNIFGIGQHRSNNQYGHCSQGVIFKKKQIMIIQQNSILNAQLIVEHTYPFWKNQLMNDISDDIIKELRRQRYRLEDDDYFQIHPLIEEKWYDFMNELGINDITILQNLKKCKWIQFNKDNQIRIKQIDQMQGQEQEQEEQEQVEQQEWNYKQEQKK